MIAAFGYRVPVYSNNKDERHGVLVNRELTDPLCEGHGLNTMLLFTTLPHIIDSGQRECGRLSRQCHASWQEA